MRVDGLTGYTVWPVDPRLQELIRLFQSVYYAPDPGPLLITLAAYAAFRLPGGNPFWTMIVGGPSSGKTELLNLITDLPNVYPVSDITPAAMLSGTKIKEYEKGATGGLLMEITAAGGAGMLAFKDFTSCLSSVREKHGSETSILGMLRELQDGYYTRRIGTDGARVLSWEGTIAVIAACTTVIDEHRAVMSAMGDRFTFFRMPKLEADRAEEMALRAIRNANKHTEQREMLAAATAAFMKDVPSTWPDRTSEQHNTQDECISGLAFLVAQCRSQISRDRYTREVEHKHDAESPSRIAGQFVRLDAGLEIIGVPAVRRYQLIRRSAFGCLPDLRLSLLSLLTKRPVVAGAESGFTIPELVDATGYGERVIRRTLEDLTLHGVITWQKAAPAYRYRMAPEWIERWNRCPPGSFVSRDNGQVAEMPNRNASEKAE